MKSIEKYKNNLMYFHDGFDTNSIMTKYKSKIIRSGLALNSLVTILKTHYNSESGKLFVDLLDNCDFSNNHISIVLIKQLEDLNSDKINTRLYRLTGEEKYLPQILKDFFIL